MIVPLVVGLIVAGASWAFTKFTKENRELSYAIDGPTNLIDQNQVGDVALSVNGLPVRQVVLYKVRVRNSGDLALRNISIRFVFEPRDPAFTLFSLRHNTSPPFEFGKIAELENAQHERRIQYELLNPGDEDNLSFVANARLQLSVFAKAENLRLKQAEVITQPSVWDRFGPWISGLLALISALLTTSYWVKSRRESEMEIAQLAEEKASLHRLILESKNADR